MGETAIPCDFHPSHWPCCFVPTLPAVLIGWFTRSRIQPVFYEPLAYTLVTIDPSVCVSCVTQFKGFTLLSEPGLWLPHQYPDRVLAIGFHEDWSAFLRNNSEMQQNVVGNFLIERRSYKTEAHCIFMFSQPVIELLLYSVTDKQQTFVALTWKWFPEKRNLKLWTFSYKEKDKELEQRLCALGVSQGRRTNWGYWREPLQQYSLVTESPKRATKASNVQSLVEYAP